MKLKKIFLILIVLLIIFYLGGQIKSDNYDKKHVVALLVLLIFSVIGHFLLKAPFLPGPIGLVLKILFIYAPVIVLFILYLYVILNIFKIYLYIIYVISKKS